MSVYGALRASLGRRPVLSYFALAFLISWGGILVLAVTLGGAVLWGPSGPPGAEGQAGASYALVLLAWFAGPSVASLLLTGVLDGRAGLRELRSRLVLWRVGARWYGVAIVVAPLLVVTVLLALSLRAPEFLPGIFTTRDKGALVLFGIAWGLVGGGFLEELGWTGFAVPRLRARHGVLGTSLIVGSAWGALHFILLGWGRSSMSGEHALAVYVLAILCFYEGTLPAYRVLMVRVYDRTGSLLVAMLMHASLSASMLIFQPPATGTAFLTWNSVLAIVLWGAACSRFPTSPPSSSPSAPRTNCPPRPAERARSRLASRSRP